MANLNKVLLMGNLTKDPELRYTPKGTAVGDLSMAVNRRVSDGNGNWSDETTFVDITVWGNTAENAQKYLSKGRGVFVEGRLQLDTWEDKTSGQKRSKLKIVADTLQFLPDGKVVVVVVVVVVADVQAVEEPRRAMPRPDLRRVDRLLIQMISTEKKTTFRFDSFLVA